MTINEQEHNSSHGWMGDYVGDNIAMLYFIHGCALSAAELPEKAIAEFKRVVE